MLSYAVILNLGLDLLIIGSITFLGSLLVLSVLSRKDLWAVYALSFPIGSSALTWSMFLLSWGGISVSSSTWIILYLILMVAVRRQIKIFFQLPIFQGEYWKEKLAEGSYQISLWVFVVMLIVLVGVLAVGRSYSAWDAAAIWSAKGYGIALNETIFAGQTWGAHGLSYPLHIPLLISIFESATGDPIPGSKLIFPMFFVSMLLGVYQYWRRNQAVPHTAILGLLFVGTIPFIFKHATTGYANLAVSSYIVLAVLWGIEGLSGNSRKAILISSILFASAAWTRPEGFYLSLLSLATIWTTGRFIYRTAPPLKDLFLPFLFIVVPWLIFLSFHGLNAQIPSVALAAIKEITQGNFNLSGLWEVTKFFFKQTIDLKTWGILYPLTAFIVILNYRKFALKSSHSMITLFLQFLILCLSIVSLYYLTSFSNLGIDWWLESGFDRMLMPASLLCGVFCIQISQAENPKVDQNISL